MPTLVRAPALLVFSGCLSTLLEETVIFCSKMRDQSLLQNPGGCYISISMGNADFKRTYHQGEILTGRLLIHHDKHTTIDQIVLALEGQIIRWLSDCALLIAFAGSARVWVDHGSYASAVKHDASSTTLW